MAGYLTDTGPQGTGPQPRVAKGTNSGRHATHIYTNAVRRGRHIEDVDDRAQNMTRKHRKMTLYAEDERASSTFPIHVVKAPSHAESQAIVSGESAETPVSIHDCGQTLDPYDCDIGQKRSTGHGDVSFHTRRSFVSLCMSGSCHAWNMCACRGSVTRARSL